MTSLRKFWSHANNHVWSKRFDTHGGEGLAIDGTGNVVLSGSFSSCVDFGGGPLETGGGAADFDIFVAKLGP